jgi:hypothetical protein
MGGTLGVLGWVVVVVGVLGAAGVAVGQSSWTVNVLTPGGPGDPNDGVGLSLGTAGGVQVGTGKFNNPGLWRGTSGSFVDLAGSTGLMGYAAGTDGVFQVGVLRTTQGARAVMWSGTAESMVDLSPPSLGGGTALAVHGGQQVGTAGGFAALWSGTAASFVNLTPNGRGTAYAVYGGRQGGRIFTTNNFEQAALWSGTAESRVDLHPGSAGFRDSVVLGMDASQQVGYLSNGLGRVRAALWSGTAESYVNLEPSGATNSYANAVFAGIQVGWARTNVTNQLPVLWRGSASSMEYLTLPAGAWRNGQATGVWSDATTLYVSGWLEDDNNFGIKKAVLWTQPIPGPGSFAALALAGVVSARRRR